MKINNRFTLTILFPVSGKSHYETGSGKNWIHFYSRTGNSKLSKEYSSLYSQYKDSITKLNKENELALTEANDEHLSQEKY